jgi:hypothetical protein
MSDDDRDEENVRLEEEQSSDEHDQEDAEAVAVVPPVEEESTQGLDDEYSEEPRQLQARDHTYLPGVSHPLMPESLLSSSNKKRRIARSSLVLQSDNDDGLVELPLLVLPPGVVIFPGSTLPIRLRHTRWIQYLGNKVAASRRGGTEEICIGVLTQVNPVVAPGRRQSSARSSWMRTGIDRRRSEHIVNILQNMNVLLDDTGGDDAEESESSEEEEEVRHQPPRDPLIGRIGTMVTIINTHGDSATDSSDWMSQERSRVWRQPTDQLVVTALGTGRFRVVESTDNGESGRSSTLPAAGHYDGDLSSIVRFYRVQEMCDEELPLPPLQSLPFAGRPLSATTTTRHDRIIHSLSSVSSIPNFVLKNMWPWKLVTDIQDRIQRVSSLRGLNVRQGDGSKNKNDEPTAFSFWAAANLPLQEADKLKLLKMESTLERLRYIQTKVVALEEEETFVCCKLCRNKISAVSNLFTVGGAEGTTGNYVNEYGAIHQTVTLRDVLEEENLIYRGRPETRDSWFPGYSWTITHCRYCHDHLGWKFQLVEKTMSSDERPKQFWGLSGASVTTLSW